MGRAAVAGDIHGQDPDRRPAPVLHRAGRPRRSATAPARSARSSTSGAAAGTCWPRVRCSTSAPTRATRSAASSSRAAGGTRWPTTATPNRSPHGLPPSRRTLSPPPRPAVRGACARLQVPGSRALSTTVPRRPGRRPQRPLVLGEPPGGGDDRGRGGRPRYRRGAPRRRRARGRPARRGTRGAADVRLGDAGRRPVSRVPEPRRSQAPRRGHQADQAGHRGAQRAGRHPGPAGGDQRREDPQHLRQQRPRGGRREGVRDAGCRRGRRGFPAAGDGQRGPGAGAGGAARRAHQHLPDPDPQDGEREHGDLRGGDHPADRGPERRARPEGVAGPAAAARHRRRAGAAARRHPAAAARLRPGHLPVPGQQGAARAGARGAGRPGR